jgi:hypothetical protein
MWQDTHYHKILRVSACVLAFTLLFVSGLVVETTSQLSRGTYDYVATAVGISVGVEPTELNQITAALTEQKRELDAREAALQEREIAVRLNSSNNQSSDYGTFILSALLFILLVLIVLNYILDFLRARERVSVNDDRQPVV